MCEKCEECGKEIIVGKDGVCSICKKTICYECWMKNHKDYCVKQLCLKFSTKGEI